MKLLARDLPWSPTAFVVEQMSSNHTNVLY